MKVKCKSCGLICGAIMGKGICPECGGDEWLMLPKEKIKEKIDRESLEMIINLLGEAYDRARWFLKKQEDLMRDPFKAQREAIEKQMDTLDPFHYRKKCKEEGLAFEIFDIKDGNKIRCRKIYFNGHIEGFKGDPCIINHIAPKIMALKGLLQQMNKDYRYFIERHLLADLPIGPIEFSKFYQAQLERIMNIVPTI